MSDPEIERRFKRLERRLAWFVTAAVAFFLATIATLIRFGLHILVR